MQAGSWLRLCKVSGVWLPWGRIMRSVMWSVGKRESNGRPSVYGCFRQEASPRTCGKLCTQYRRGACFFLAKSRWRLFQFAHSDSMALKIRGTVRVRGLLLLLWSPHHDDVVYLAIMAFHLRSHMRNGNDDLSTKRIYCVSFPQALLLVCRQWLLFHSVRTSRT